MSDSPRRKFEEWYKSEIRNHDPDRPWDDRGDRIADGMLQLLEGKALSLTVGDLKYTFGRDDVISRELFWAWVRIGRRTERRRWRREKAREYRVRDYMVRHLTLVHPAPSDVVSLKDEINKAKTIQLSRPEMETVRDGLFAGDSQKKIADAMNTSTATVTRLKKDVFAELCAKLEFIR